VAIHRGKRWIASSVRLTGVPAETLWGKARQVQRARPITLPYARPVATLFELRKMISANAARSIVPKLDSAPLLAGCSLA